MWVAKLDVVTFGTGQVHVGGDIVKQARVAVVIQASSTVPTRARRLGRGRDLNMMYKSSPLDTHSLSIADFDVAARRLVLLEPFQPHRHGQRLSFGTTTMDRNTRASHSQSGGVMSRRGKELAVRKRYVPTQPWQWMKRGTVQIRDQLSSSRIKRPQHHTVHRILAASTQPHAILPCRSSDSKQAKSRLYHGCAFTLAPAQ